MKASYIKDVTEENPLLSLQDIRDVLYTANKEGIEICSDIEAIFWLIKQRYFDKYKEQTKDY